MYSFLLKCILKHLGYLVLETRFEQYTLNIYIEMFQHLENYKFALVTFFLLRE